MEHRSTSADSTAPELPWGIRRGEVVRDSTGQLWRRSNGPNIYPINEAGHRLRIGGELVTLRIAYALGTQLNLGPFTQDDQTEALRR